MTKFMSRDEQYVRIPMPINGLNTMDDELTMHETMSPDMSNVVIDQYKGIGKREGFVAINSNPIYYYNAGQLNATSGSNKFTGVGTAWSANAGDGYVKISGVSGYFLVASVSGDTTLNVTGYTGPTVASSNYWLVPQNTTFLYYFTLGNAGSGELLHFSDSAVNRISTQSPSTPATKTDFTVLSGAAVCTYPNSCVNFQSGMYIADSATFQVYNGTTITTVGGTPTPSDPDFCTVYTIGNADYLAIAKEDNSQFAFSDVNAPATWPVANRYYAGQNDGQKITGITTLNGNFIIFKENSMFQFSGIPGNGTLRKLTDNIGCIGKGRFINDGNYIYFLGARNNKVGVYRFDGISETQCMTNSIENLINYNYTVGTDYAPIQNWGQAYINLFENRLYVSGYVMDSDIWATLMCYTDRPFSYPDTNKLMYPWIKSSRVMNSMVTYGAGANSVYGKFMGVGYKDGLTEKGYVYADYFTNSDNGANINAYLKTKQYDFGTLDKRKELLKIRTQPDTSNNTSITFRTYKDYVTNTFSTFSFGSSAFMPNHNAEIRFTSPQLGLMYQFGFANSGSASFLAQDLSITYKMENL